MRILLDESLPAPLASSLVGHQVKTVGQCGWTGIKNGKLLALAGSNFDVMLTADRNIQYQQNMKTLPIAVVVLVTPDGLLPSFHKLMQQLLAALSALVPRTLIELKL
jgi:predicted nuclease of predicted toxin-antitoxin system